MNHRIKEEDRKKIADGVFCVLADSYVLYLKTQNYHWNVTGVHFGPLHSMFQEHYEDLAEAVDTLAERIRALGHKVNANFSEFTKHSALSFCSSLLSHIESNLGHFILGIPKLLSCPNGSLSCELISCKKLLSFI